MKNLYPIGLFLAALVMVSCTDSNPANFEVEKPQSVAVQESLNEEYDPLKTYVDSVNANFTLGAGVSLSEYNEQGVMYRLVNSNFQEVTTGYGMKHGAVVQADGSLALAPVTDFLSAAEEAGISVYGHTLAWHTNQNAEYLNSTIAPTVIPGNGEPALDPSVITNSGFENGAAGWVGWGNESTRGLSAEGEGYGGTGYAYIFTNPSVTDFWSAQVAYDPDSLLEMESTYELNFKVRADASGTIRAEVQSTSDYSSDSFGTFAISPDWTEHTLETTITAEDRDRFVISFGDYAGTVYIDDITLRRVNPDGVGDQIIEKTPEEKENILSGELERWISGIMEVSNDNVDAWDVVNEPMSDGNPFELKTGEGKDLNSDEFYWQDYLGKDYGVQAFKLARQYADEDDLLFINDYNLEYNLDKCRGLIDYVEYIENNGATVDGIGTQMHISINTSKENIAEMFKLLAATGKLVKVSELDIGLGGVSIDNATTELYEQQSEMYKYVVQKYFEIIPEQQRYGITVWSPLDSPEDSSWRAGEPIGLWTLDYNRKRAYAGFADGLKTALGIED